MDQIISIKELVEMSANLDNKRCILIEKTLLKNGFKLDYVSSDGTQSYDKGKKINNDREQVISFACGDDVSMNYSIYYKIQNHKFYLNLVDQMIKFGFRKIQKQAKFSPYASLFYEKSNILVSISTPSTNTMYWFIVVESNGK